MERRRDRRERERQELKAQPKPQPRQAPSTLSRREALRIGALSALALAGGALFLRSQSPSEDQGLGGNPTPEKQPTFLPEKQIPQTPEIPERDFRLQASIAVDNFNRVMHLEIDKNYILDNLVYVPNLATMPQTVKDELCSYVVCSNAAGFTGGKDPEGKDRKMYVFKDKVETTYSNALASNQNIPPAVLKEYLNTYLRQIVNHETVHFLAGQRYEVTPELDEMIRKYANVLFHESGNPQDYKPTLVAGLQVFYGNETERKELTLFIGLDEGLAYCIENYVARMTAKDPRFVQENKNFFLGPSRLLTDLFQKLPEGSMKRVLTSLQQPKPFEAFIGIVGESFEADPGKQFERGFQILLAVNENRPDLYREYTTKK